MKMMADFIQGFFKCGEGFSVCEFRPDAFGAVG